MGTKDAILELRKRLNMSQDEFAEKLFVTRQAVSRWEKGDTIPNTDTLKLIVKTFNMSVDQLLGYPAGLCQSCGMTLEHDSDKGTEQDGSKSEEFCAFSCRPIEEAAVLKSSDFKTAARHLPFQLFRQETKNTLRLQ